MSETQIEFSLFWRFSPAEYEEVAAPADMSYQWRCSFVVFVRIVKLPHAEQVAALESAKIRMTSGNVTRQLVNDSFTPYGILELLAYVSAHFPVKSDQARVDGLQGALTRAAD
jgi:hypothetical protein